MNDLNEKIYSAINDGIAFLTGQQLSDGHFRSYMSNNDAMQVYEGDPKGWLVEDGVVFPNILIGNSLLFLNETPGVNDILNRLTHFLLAQRKAGSVWNHFTPDHFLYLLCPFDLDDTACASAFLKARQIDFPSNKELLLNNTNRDGLFYTWITFGTQFTFTKAYWRLSLRELKRPIKSFFFWKKMSCSRNDVDAVVNTNVLYYLPDAPNAQQVTRYLVEVIKNEQEATCDKWYKNPLSIYYFISRNHYSGITGLEPIRQLIIDRVLKMVKPGGGIGETPLDTALAVCTLLNFNYDDASVRAAIYFLLNGQAANGSWARRGFYYDGPKKTVSWGSEALTTGFCLEALGRYKALRA